MHGCMYGYMVTCMGLYIDRKKMNERKRERMGIPWPLCKFTKGFIVGKANTLKLLFWTSKPLAL